MKNLTTKLKKLAKLQNFDYNNPNLTRGAKKALRFQIIDFLSKNGFDSKEDFDQFIYWQEKTWQEKPKAKKIKSIQKPLGLKDLAFIANHPYDPAAQALCIRLLEVEVEYQNTLKNLDKSPESIKNHILKKYLKYIPTNTGKNIKEYFLKENEYPYNLASGLIHYNIWNFDGQAITKPAIDQTLAYLQKTHNKQIDYVFNWEWPTENKSVPQFRHIHLIIKFKSK